MAITTFWNLREAYETSTMNYNRFADMINSIKWDDSFYADGEYTYLLDDMSFSTPSLDPFKISKNWKPSAIFADGSYIEF